MSNVLVTTKTQSFSVFTSQSTVEWYTPLWLIDRAKAVMGSITCDPATCDAAQAYICADIAYTSHGLSQPWSGNVWLNPPFDDTATWVQAFYDKWHANEFERGILLVNTTFGYKWYEQAIRTMPCVLLRERLHFIPSVERPKSAAKKAQTLFLLNVDLTHFSDLGVTVCQI